MEFDLSTILVFATGLLAGVIAGLKIIAPRTATLKDDKVLEYAEKVQVIVDSLPKPAAKPKA